MYVHTYVYVYLHISGMFVYACTRVYLYVFVVYKCVSTHVCIPVCARIYLYGLYKSVAKLQSSRSRRGAKRRRPPLETPNNTSIFPVLLNRHPEQIPHPVNYNNSQKELASA